MMGTQGTFVGKIVCCGGVNICCCNFALQLIILGEITYLSSALVLFWVSFAWTSRLIWQAATRRQLVCYMEIHILDNYAKNAWLFNSTYFFFPLS